MAFHTTPKNGRLPLIFSCASILPIMIATIFLMQMVLIDADHNWRMVVRKVDPSHPPTPTRARTRNFVISAPPPRQVSPTKRLPRRIISPAAAPNSPHICLF
ncbi:hypothetical protein FH972_027318 [Carpinus fangiana]|uniref:Transmembrane protein n=1 Tax=Carpinus fangiana TaxID=176857 RepID=A0A5N6PH50_9ROSI|nr:hypothetical protein FH972_027318 [Carpinus fangiana]